MANYTPQQLADQLNSLHAKAVNIVEGTIAGAALPGGSISFTYRNPIDGQTYTATGTAWNTCSPSRVSALKLPDGTWIVVGAHEAETARSVVHVDRRARPVEKKGGNIKVLFSTIEGSDLVFYVGGDRPVPKRIGKISSSAIVFDAIVTNTGSDCTVGLHYLIDGAHHFRVFGQSNWELVPVSPLYAYALLPYSQGLTYIGNGFWAQFNPPGGDRFTGYASQASDLQESNNQGGLTPYNGDSRLNLFSETSTASQTKTFSPSPTFPITGGGSGSYSSATSGTYFDFTDGYFSDTRNEQSRSQETRSLAFSPPLFSLFSGNLNQSLGSYTESYSDQSSRSVGQQPIVESNGWYRKAGIQPYTQAGLTQEDSHYSWDCAITPTLSKTSTVSDRFTRTSQQGGDYNGGERHYSGRDDQNYASTRYSPLILENSKSAIYEKRVFNRSSASADADNITPVTSSQSVDTTEYFLVKGEIETRLDGDLPKNKGGGVEFRNQDNLVGSNYDRVTIEAGLFDRFLPLGVDIYALSATTTKRTVKQRVFKLPTPTSGMPATPEGIAALNARLKDSLPVTIGNMTIYNASYHP